MLSETVLENLTYRGDVVADRAIEAVRVEGGALAVSKVIGLLMSDASNAIQAWPKPLQDVLNGCVIACAEHDRKDAEAFFAEHGPEVMLSLCCLALPSDYLNERGARQLVETGALLLQTRRRLASTAQMFVDVFSPGGLAPDGSGRLAVVRVRLLHAAVRSMSRRSSTLSSNSSPVPINQADLLYAYTSFTWLVLEGLKRVGRRPPPRQVEAYLAVWRAVAPAFGIEPEWVEGDAQVLGERFRMMRAHHDLPSEEARRLAAALTGVIDGLLPAREIVGDSTATDLLRYFLGAQTADSLGLCAPSGIIARYPRLASWAFQLGLKRKHTRRVAVLTLGNLSAREKFHLPPAVTQAWAS